MLPPSPRSRRLRWQDVRVRVPPHPGPSRAAPHTRRERLTRPSPGSWQLRTCIEDAVI